MNPYCPNPIFQPMRKGSFSEMMQLLRCEGVKSIENKTELRIWRE